MRMLITALLALVAGCSGDSPAGKAACGGNLYDACLDEHDCTSGNCHNFSDQSFEVCSTSCTVGNDAPCMTTADGSKATCVAIGAGPGGICTPPAPNDCKTR